MAQAPGRGLRNGRESNDVVAHDELRLLVRVASMYHEEGMRQADIATQMHLSPARVSRLLAKASSTGIVRTVVSPPAGLQVELEQRLEREFGLDEAIVVDADESANALTLATAAARHLELTLAGERSLGVATWSSSLLSVVEQLHSKPGISLHTVVQLVGGFGSPAQQAASSRMLLRLATLTNADAVVIPAPGMLGSELVRNSLLTDQPVQEALSLARSCSVALVGIGSIEPSWHIRKSGNASPDASLEALRAAGAVGDVCLRYFDDQGRPVASELDRRVVGISQAELLRIPRRVGVAGGMRKLDAILGALRGGLMTTLVTDSEIARAVLSAGR